MERTLIDFKVGETLLASVGTILSTNLPQFINILHLGTSNFFLLGYVCIGLSSVVLLIVLVSISFFFCRTRDKCHCSSCPTNTCNCFFGLISFLLTIALLIFIFVNYALESLCEYTTLVAKDPNVAHELKTIFSAKYEGLLSSSCLSDEGTELGNFLNIKDQTLLGNYNNIGNFLDGFSYYDSFLKQLEPDKNNNSIVQQSVDWELYKKGIKFNFDNVPSKSFV